MILIVQKKTVNILLYYKCTCVYTNFSSSDDEDSQHSTPYNQEQVDKEKFARYVSIEYTLQLILLLPLRLPLLLIQQCPVHNFFVLRCSDIIFCMYMMYIY